MVSTISSPVGSTPRSSGPARAAGRSSHGRGGRLTARNCYECERSACENWRVLAQVLPDRAHILHVMGRPPVITEHATRIHGHTVTYRTAGESGPFVLLVHGITGHGA